MSNPQPKGRRLITEKRKAQNREAQRKYRQKLNNRLKHLERLASQLNETDVGQVHRTDKVDEASSFLPISTTVNPSSEVDSVNKPDNVEERAYLATDNVLQTFSDDIAGVPGDWIDSSEQFYSSDNLNPAIAGYSADDFLIDLDPGVEGFDQVDTSLIARSVTLSPNNNASSISLNSPGMALISSSLQLHDGSRNSRRPRRPGTDAIALDIIRQLRLDDSMENQELIKVAIDRGHNIRDVFIAGLKGLGSTFYNDSSPRSPALSDPKKNNLNLVHTSTLSAYLSIADALGLSIPQLYVHQSASPFYQPQRDESEDLTALIQSFSDKITPHLRPTPAQLLQLHEPWMDLIPFPTLRERLITYSSMKPPLVNLADFKNDIFLNDGIFCWHATPRTRDSSGHAWDMRSWEAEPWFLKKWWLLLGGEEADLWAQTTWWRSIRGEEKVELKWTSD